MLEPGDSVCEDYNKTIAAPGVKLSVFSHLPQCTADPLQVHQIENNFCCNDNGNRVPCFTTTVPSTRSAPSKLVDTMSQ